MINLARFFQRSGGWVYFVGSLTVYLATYFLDSIFGILALLLGALLALSDPAINLLAQRRGWIQSLQRGAWVSWILAAIAAALFFLRFALEAPAAKLADQSALLPRLRLLLLVLYFLSYAASVIYRIMSGLSESLEAAASLSVIEQRARYLRSAAYSIFAVVPAIVLVNYAANVRNPTLDLTPGYFSFSENGRAIVRSVTREVDVYVFLPEKQFTRRRGDTPISEVAKYEDDIRLMMDQLPVVNAKIRLHYLNADLEAFNTSEFGNVTNGTIIFRTLKPSVSDVTADSPYVERRVYVNTESDLKKLEREAVRALVFVAAPARNVYFTSLNGERYAIPSTERNPGGVEALKSQLRYFNANLRSLDANNGWPGQIPEDADAVFVLGPTAPLDSSARAALLDYLRGGGKLLVAVDPAGREDFSWMLSELGGGVYSLKRGRLTNTTRSGVLVSDSYGTHRITEDFSGSARRFYLVGPDFGHLEQGAPPAPQPDDGAAESEEKADEAAPPEDQGERVARRAVPSLKELAPTSILYSAYSTFDDQNQNARREENEPQTRHTLGVAFEKKGLAGGPKLAVFAGVDWMADRHTQFSLENVNMALAAQTLFWMVENPLAAGIEPGERESRSVLVTEEMKLRLIVLCIFVFPIAMTGALALAMALYRRKRRFIEAAAHQE